MSWWNYPAKFEKDGSLAAMETVTDESVAIEMENGTAAEMENGTATEMIAATGTTESAIVTPGTPETAVSSAIEIVGKGNLTGVTQGTLICRCR